MSDNLSGLSAKMIAIEDKVREHVAKVLRYGNNIVDRHRLDAEVGQLIEEFEEALVLSNDAVAACAAAVAGKTGEAHTMWERNEERLSYGELGRLMMERHEIQKQMLDLLDDANPWLSKKGCK
jgi:hypothetical protein